MTLEEIFAEKTRAALTRNPPAIRDFFDIWYAKEKQGFDFSKITVMIAQKIGNLPYTINETSDTLQIKIETELNPVLNSSLQKAFNLDEIHHFIFSLKP
jgi:predicted nucleotidyltransferase component of viral defense system